VVNLGIKVDIDNKKVHPNYSRDKDDMNDNDVCISLNSQEGKDYNNTYNNVNNINKYSQDNNLPDSNLMA